MISATKWVPRNAPSRVPRRTLISAAERDLLALKQHHAATEAAAAVAAVNAVDGAAPLGTTTTVLTTAQRRSRSDGESSDEEEAPQRQQFPLAAAAGITATAMVDTDANPAAAAAVEEDPVMAELNMDAYDQEDDAFASLLIGAQKLSVFDDNAQDPYITVPDDEDQDSDEEEAVKEGDAWLLVARTKNEESSLDVYCFEERKSHMFVHHSIMLPSLPLCVEWLNKAPLPQFAEGDSEQQQGSDLRNLVAVGTFDVGIELWDLDVMDALEPIAALGGREHVDQTSDMASFVKRRDEDVDMKAQRSPLEDASQSLASVNVGAIREESHTGAVTSLAWSMAHRERLASGSEDTMIKLWDVSTLQCVNTISLWKGDATRRVEALAWNPSEPSVLLTGAAGGALAVGDTRNAQNCTVFFSAGADVDVECSAWFPRSPFVFCAGLEDGIVKAFDARRPGSDTLFSLEAHRGCAVTVLSFHSSVGLFATAATSGEVKLWSLGDDLRPSLVATREMKSSVGRVFALDWDWAAPAGSPFVLACGGDKDMVAVWDAMENEKVARLFGDDASGEASMATASSSSAAMATGGGRRAGGRTVVPDPTAQRVNKYVAKSGAKKKGKKKKKNRK